MTNKDNLVILNSEEKLRKAINYIFCEIQNKYNNNKYHTEEIEEEFTQALSEIGLSAEEIEEIKFQYNI